MKKVLKNILKWLICVFLTFTVMYTMSQFYEMPAGIYLHFNGEKAIEEILEDVENLEDTVKMEQENMNASFNNEGEDERIMNLYNKYPTGTAIFFIRIWNIVSVGNLAIISLTLGIIIGTAIYMLLDTDKKGLKIVITLYILSVAILGFVQGFINISGEDLTLLDRWMFPDEYITPVTIVFALVVLVRVIRQKEIARILNEKLKQIKEEKSK